jgi:SAM-dependent methyltransferase
MFPLAKWMSEIPLLASDIYAIRERMNSNQWRLLFPAADQYPQYYRRTYHWQSDGYLSSGSADRYEVSAELQLRGAAQMIRRLCLPYFISLKERDSRILDIGCGTGKLLPTITKAYPLAKVVGIDISTYYIDKARDFTAKYPSVEVLIANGYDTGLPDCNFNGIVTVFLLHELPGSLRRRLFAECYRLLKPDGVLVLTDAIQDQDDLFMADYLKWILERFHEPYFIQYMKAPIEQELNDAGFKVRKSSSYFLAKYFVATK